MKRTSGSSPLARGLQRHVLQQSHVHGIIPARAGFTSHWGQYPRPNMDHPRSRGVYHFRFVAAQVNEGSSPLARGLLGGVAGIESRIRIIPARAGFTVQGKARTREPVDHPRSRGVYPGPCGPVLRESGSSPLARGLRHTERSGTPPRRDHPRSRGVYSALTSPHGASIGSSPLARGLPPPRTGRAGSPGIIPARAGFTPLRRADSGRSPDHPRSRGVYGRVLFRRGL